MDLNLHKEKMDKSVYLDSGKKLAGIATPPEEFFKSLQRRIDIIEEKTNSKLSGLENRALEPLLPHIKNQERIRAFIHKILKSDSLVLEFDKIMDKASIFKDPSLLMDFIKESVHDPHNKKTILSMISNADFLNNKNMAAGAYVVAGRQEENITNLKNFTEDHIDYLGKPGGKMTIQIRGRDEDRVLQLVRFGETKVTQKTSEGKTLTRSLPLFSCPGTNYVYHFEFGTNKRLQRLVENEKGTEKNIDKYTPDHITAISYTHNPWVKKAMGEQPPINPVA